MVSVVASVAGAALTGAGGVASGGAVMVEAGSGVGTGAAKGGVGAGAAGVGLAAMVAASPAESGTTGGLELSTVASEAGSFSGGGVGSEICGGAFGSCEESEDAVRRLLKDVGKPEAVEPDWGTEKAGLLFDSGGLNKLPDTTPLDRSAPVDSSADF